MTKAVAVHALIRRIPLLLPFLAVFAAHADPGRLTHVAVASPAVRFTAPALLADEAREDSPELRSRAFTIIDQLTGHILIERNAGDVQPIASLTKLMTAMVVLDRRQSLSEVLTVTRDDVDTLRHSRSRLPVGARLSREDLLRLALMASENRAASALARNYPGGLGAFVRAMNAKARSLGLSHTHFAEGTGLSADNVSTARELARMALAASRYPLIRAFTTTSSYAVDLKGRQREFRNTNSLTRDPDWEIGLSKTGYIREAGRCLVMQAWLQGRPVLIVLLDSFGKYTRTADARRLRRWLAERPWERVLVAHKDVTG
ncbi:D-alanyl-D-alanine endopeptidase [Nitrogeniibacter mangrovi]|uniref:D-alanyl-D-alanine endopeptidase n=1 Tax=Nitrogeniibacter mangrovi TaxID=2016596 RepID=A0A6C1B8C8_9RHOO|nr:D-alanyl-D-alanine endopeptidase [Nitrogeniibacter mangrovi]QID18978.1 D-alanyl-D-alanine endopeptidase [Nitrogeniibacter mangrovi]